MLFQIPIHGGMAVFATVAAPSPPVRALAIKHAATVSVLFAVTDAHVTPLFLMTNISERAGRV